MWLLVSVSFGMSLRRKLNSLHLVMGKFGGRSNGVTEVEPRALGYTDMGGSVHLGGMPESVSGGGMGEYVSMDAGLAECGGRSRVSARDEQPLASQFWSSAVHVQAPSSVH